MKSTTTYLHFNGNCRTAMAFYRECFGGGLEVMAYPDASGTPNTDPKAPVQHSMIAQGGQALLMASDYPPGLDTSSQGNNFSVFIDCSSNGELEKLFTALSQDGKSPCRQATCPLDASACATTSLAPRGSSTVRPLRTLRTDRRLK